MQLQLPIECPRCSRENDAAAHSCTLCGHLFQTPRGSASKAPAVLPALTRPVEPEPESVGPSAVRRWLFLFGGLATLPVLLFVPLLDSIGWHLAAIVHELGHTAAGWSTGHPSIPRLRPGLSADTLFQDQVGLLSWGIFAGFLWMAVRAWREDSPTWWRVLWTGAAALQPLLAFTSLRSLYFTMGGHGGELIFAVVCFWRAYTGGFTHSLAERAAYSVVGWYLVGANLRLTLGLAFNALARADYGEIGPCGVLNDYIQAASFLGAGLEQIAFGMTFVALLSLPVALVLTRLLR